MKHFYLNIALLFFFSSQIINAQGIIKDDFLVNNDSIDIYNRNPAITMNSTGDFIIAWNDHRNGWGNWDVFFQIYNSNGNPLGTNVLINDDGSIYWVQTDPAIAMNDAGNFVIAWEDDRVGYKVIYYQLFDSNQNPMGANQKANDFAAVAFKPAVAMDDAGNFVIVWIDERSPGIDTDIYFQMFDSGGNKIGSNIMVNDSSTALQQAPSIAIDGNGNFVIAWKDFRNGSESDIYLQRFNSNGIPIGSNVRVDDDAGNASQYISSIAMDGSGNFVIVWDDDRNGGVVIYMQMYDNNGNTIGSNIKVSDYSGTYPSIAMEVSGDFVVTWMTSGSLPNVEAQRYFANGNPNGGNYLVVEDGPNQIETVPQVACNSTQIAFAWDDNRRNEFRSDIYGKLVNWNWGGVTDVEIFNDNLLTEFSLSQNYPNPFNPSTKIKYSIPQSSNIVIRVFDVLGDEVAILVNEELSAGEYEVEFKSHSGEGRNLPAGRQGLTSGVYFYQLKTNNFIQTKKMLFLK